MSIALVGMLRETALASLTVTSSDATSDAGSGTDFDMLILELKAHQRSLLNHQRETRAKLATLKARFERLDLMVQGLIYELDIQRRRRETLQNYPSKTFMELLTDTKDEEDEILESNDLVSIQAMQAYYDKLRERLRLELQGRQEASQRLLTLEKERQKLREMELKEKSEWNSFKINFKGLCQSCQIFMPYLGTTLEALRAEVSSQLAVLLEEDQDPLSPDDCQLDDSQLNDLCLDDHQKPDGQQELDDEHLLHAGPSNVLSECLPEDTHSGDDQLHVASPSHNQGVQDGD